mmetsp:Transcript_81407/g.252670  ORF Transcript_81407/g.252670 Transcript_81407/m.252670 type:complete len:80 (+) Transcript_81407:174-413(+)
MRSLPARLVAPPAALVLLAERLASASAAPQPGKDSVEEERKMPAPADALDLPSRQEDVRLMIVCKALSPGELASAGKPA